MALGFAVIALELRLIVRFGMTDQERYAGEKEETKTMYRDVEQWSNIRRQILQKGVSIHQVSRDTGIDRKTVRKMLAHPLPKPYGPRSRSYPKLGPHTASIQRMLRENATLPPTARHSVRTIYERIREEEGFRGSYGSVKDYARPRTADNCCIWDTLMICWCHWRRDVRSTSCSCCPVPIHRSYPPIAQSSSSVTLDG